VHQLKPLRSYLRSQVGHARDIAARPGKAGDKSNRDWVAPHQEHDRYRRGRRLGRERGRGVGRGNHCHMTVNQIGRQCRQSIVAVFRPAVFDRYVPALGIAGLFQTLMESR
jgi:hypothetical protein